MKKTILAIMLALALVVIPAGNAFAAISDDVEVTATPSILSITVVDKGSTPDPANWIINDVAEATGQLIVRDTTYYANPLGDTTVPVGVVDGECHFTLTNDGDVNADIDISMTDLSGMTIVAGGYTVNGATSFGASAYISGAAFPGGNVNLFTTDTDFQNNFAPGSVDWGVALKTQTDSFTVAGDLSGTIDLIAEEV